MIDTVSREAENRVLPHMIPVLLEILRSGEPSFQKDSLEFQFRRTLLEILHRIPFIEVVRPQVQSLFTGLLSLLRHDNEEMGTTCCKMINDIMRGLRSFNEEVFSEFMAIFLQLVDNLKNLLVEVFSEDSREVDATTSLPAIRSFKVLAEYKRTGIAPNAAFAGGKVSKQDISYPQGYKEDDEAFDSHLSVGEGGRDTGYSFEDARVQGGAPDGHGGGYGGLGAPVPYAGYSSVPGGEDGFTRNENGRPVSFGGPLNRI